MSLILTFAWEDLATPTSTEQLTLLLLIPLSLKVLDDGFAAGFTLGETVLSSAD